MTALTFIGIANPVLSAASAVLGIVSLTNIVTGFLSQKLNEFTGDNDNETEPSPEHQAIFNLANQNQGMTH